MKSSQSNSNLQSPDSYLVRSYLITTVSGVELLQLLTLNLCGFDPGLEAGSRKAIKSNLVIYLVP